MITLMPQSVRKFLPYFLAFLCSTTLLPGLFLPFEDSEIWGITSSRRLLEHPFEVTSAHFKPLFSLIFGTVVTLASSDWMALVASRWVTIVFASAGLFAAYSIGLILLDRDRRLSFTALYYALFATLPLMILHFTKARSDSISASVFFVGLYLLLALENRPLWVKGLIYGLTGLAALMITPKSIDLLAILAVTFWFVSAASPSLRKLLWTATPVVVPLLVVLLTTRNLMVRSMVYWFDTYSGLSIFSPITWVSTTRSLAAAPISSFIIGAGLVAGLVQFRKLSRNERLLATTGAIVAFFIVIHSQKYLFFLSSRAPLLAIGALPGFHLLAEFVVRRSNVKTVLRVLLAAFSVSLALTIARLDRIPAFEMRYQHAVLDSLSAYLDRSQTATYWDAIGLFPKRNRIFHFPSPGDRTNTDLLRYVEISRPPMILRTSKMELLEPHFMQWLRPRYFAINDQIYVRFRVLQKTDSCRLETEDVLKIVEEEHFNFPLGLFIRTSTLGSWVRTSFFSASGIEHGKLDEKTLRRGKIELPDCRRSDVEFALVEDGPWSAMPAPNFTPFFGYDGRL
jgi:hypothetical protein